MMGRSYGALQIIADPGVVCAGAEAHNLGFCRDAPSLADVTGKIDCFAKNMVVDTWEIGCSVN